MGTSSLSVLAMNQTRIAPGPRGELLIGNLRAFRRDVLKLMLDGAKDFGDVVRFRLGPLTVHLITIPTTSNTFCSRVHPITIKRRAAPPKFAPFPGTACW